MENRLYSVTTDYVPKGVVSTKNKFKTWAYGYNSDYDMVVISKDGTIGEIYEINSIKIALPPAPKGPDRQPPEGCFTYS